MRLFPAARSGLRRSALVLSLSGAALASGALMGCNKGGDDAKPADAKPKVAWPAKPTDGSPVVVQFKAMEGEGKERRAVFDVFNFDETENISELRMELQYLDASGKVLKTFPHTQISPFYNKEVGQLKAGFFMPPETVKVAAVVSYAKLNTREWGSKPGARIKAPILPTAMPASTAPSAAAPSAAAPASAAPASAAP